MERKSDSFSDFQKLIILCFDEIYNIYLTKLKLTKAEQARLIKQISIARGLFSKWK